MTPPGGAFTALGPRLSPKFLHTTYEQWQELLTTWISKETVAHKDSETFIATALKN